MTDQHRQGELTFATAREQIERAIESSGSMLIEMPSFSLEKGETRFSFSPERIDPALIPGAISVIKSRVEVVEIHSAEQGYLVFQSYEPGQEQKSSWNHTRFKFITLGSQSKIEVSRRGNFNQEEVLTCLELYRLFHPGEKTSDPAQILANLGVSVYQSGPPEHSSATNREEGSPWSSIGGYESVIQEVEESILLPLLQPDVFSRVAQLTRNDGKGNTPAAILFEGPPGVGKTTFARIIGTVSRIPLVYVPIENILSKYYGESAKNMSAIFDAASMYDRVILFLDEIDSLATSREGGMYEATRRVLSVLLRKIDGFDSRPGVLTIGATNRSGDLDAALLSRFDHTIRFPLPDLKERAAIFSRYAIHLSSGDLLALGDASEGLSGREIQDICEYAERRHARSIIDSGASPTPPPVETYTVVLKQKMASHFS